MKMGWEVDLAVQTLHVERVLRQVGLRCGCVLAASCGVPVAVGCGGRPGGAAPVPLREARSGVGCGREWHCRFRPECRCGLRTGCRLCVCAMVTRCCVTDVEEPHELPRCSWSPAAIAMARKKTDTVCHAWVAQQRQTSFSI